MTWLHRRGGLLAMVALFAVVGCTDKSGGRTGGTGGSGAGGAPGTAGTGGAPGDPAINTAFAADALAIAADYAGWGRVDDEIRWAPTLCRQPLPGVARMSDSDDGDTHGRKLYSVFVKNHAAYPTGPHDGQVVVKESWIPEAVTDQGATYAPSSYRADSGAGDHFYPYAQKDGVLYRASARAGLFIMYKADAAAPAAATDAGWVYATVSATGELTAAGRVASCMGCHEDAPHDRLFGLPPPQAL